MANKTLKKSAKWKKVFAATIGSSSAAAACEKSRFLSRRELMLRLAGQITLPDLTDNPDVKRGVLLEHPACRALGWETKKVYGSVQQILKHKQSEFLFNEKYPFAHTLPDAWLNGDPVEMKVPRDHVWNRYRLQGFPLEYMIQAQHHMAITGKEICHLAAFNPVTTAILWQPVGINLEVVGQIMEKERDCYERAMAGDIPEPGEEEQTTDLAIPEPEGELTVFNDPKIVRAAECYVAVRQYAEEAQEFVDEAKQQLIDVANGCEAYEVDGVLRVYNREQEGRQTFDWKACVAEHPEMKKYLKRGKPFKTFKAFKLKEH